jgi:two-component system, NtrC family, nitrogen regulation response regulator NtrX
MMSMARSVLVIDDEASIRQSLAGALKDEGYRVKTAASGAEGIEMLRSDRADLVLLDIWMPDMDGLETLKQIKVEWADLTVSTGHETGSL